MFLYKKWYERNPAIIIFLILLFPLGLTLMMKYSDWSKNTKGIILGCYIGLLVFSTFIVISKYLPVREDPIRDISSNTLDTPEKFISPVPLTDNSAYYEKLASDARSNVENYYYLYKGEDKSEGKMREISTEIRIKNCKKACNISIYDDKRAYDIDMEYFNLTDPVAQEEWKQLNYIYVAEHLLEWVPAGKLNEFSYYPYKNATYNELIKGN